MYLFVLRFGQIKIRFLGFVFEPIIIFHVYAINSTAVENEHSNVCVRGKGEGICNWVEIKF